MEGGSQATVVPDAARAGAELAVGQQVARYEIRRRIGSGGMGAVYAAFDPELDREIAIKVLHAGGAGPAEHNRLLREARAMARLSHPNVVGALDVGEIGDEVFVAMELIDGSNLRDWMTRGRPWRKVLDVLRLAGAGLCAAHDAGMVHRDFKPDNVFIGSTGRVAVGDFGLVGDASPLPAQPASREPGAAPVISRVTTGAGTPAYMAPEQQLGRAATTASDQFAFCVTSWEALYGERPFAVAADTASADRARLLAAEIILGKRRPPPRGRRVPGWIRRALERGLTVDPTKRWPSLHVLVARLDHRRRRRRGFASVGMALAIVAGAAGALAWHRAPGPLCGDASVSMSGVWDPVRRAAVATAFRASGRAHADASLALVYRALDDYAATWVTMRDDACRATHERHEQSPQLLDLRVSCLEHRREELRVFTDELGHADPALVDKAATGARALSSLALCSDTAALVSVLPPPDDPQLRVRIDRTRAGLARVNALWIAGKLADAHREIAPLITEAKAIGYAPLQAETLFRDEQIDVRPPDLKVAAARLRDAIVLAEAGHDQEMQLLAWAALPFVQAVDGDRDAAIESMRHGEALLDGLGRPLRLEAQVMVSLGAAASVAERLADAERWQLRALRAREQLYPPGDPALGPPHASLGNIYMSLERHEDSLRHQRAALDIYERAFGDAHPRTCATLVGLAGELEQADRLDEALAIALRAVAGCERAFGSSSAALSLALMNESNVLQRLGRFDDALPLLLRAQAISDAASGPNSPDASRLLANLASLRSHRGELDTALDLIERALVIATRSFGSDSAQVKHQTETKVEILLLAGRYQNAIAPAERYRQLVLKVPDGDVRGRMILGRVLVASGRHAEARRLLAPIFDPAHPLTGKPVDIAAARFELARALDDDPSQSKAREWAARDALAKLGRPGEEMLRDLDNELPVKVGPHR
jgi:eukaryotic-like serine/threonine-protein kinase